MTILTLICVSLACIFLTSSHAKPYQLVNGNGVIQQQSSNSSASLIANDLSLAGNINFLLLKLSRSPDTRISQSLLVDVLIHHKEHDFETRNPHDLRALSLLFKPAGSQSLGFKLLGVRNDFDDWETWVTPRWLDISDNVWAAFHPIFWPPLQASMDIDEAARLLNAAGYDSPFFSIEISQFGTKPIAYCFNFSWQTYAMVRVEVETRRVIAFRGGTCSF